MKPIIRTIAATLALLLSGGVASAAIETAEASRFTPGSNHTEAFSVTTPAGATAMQFTMTVPEGFALYNTTVTLAKSRATDHTYRLNKTGDRTYKCVIYSNANTPFASTSGELFSLRFKADSDAERGDYPLEFTDITTANATGAETPMPDATVILPVRINPTGVTVTPTSAEIFVGEEFKFNGSVTPAEADQDITWQISDAYKSIATIDETGLAKGLAPGSVTIYARCTQDTYKYTTVQLKVKAVLPESVTLTPSALELRKGEGTDLTATVLPDNAANKSISWSSSNTSCVSVNNSGHITAKATGTAIITATATANSAAKASCTVMVLPPLTTSLRLNRTSLTLTIGESSTLTCTPTPSDAKPEPRWTSSNPSVAHVDETGKVTALNAGEATVTATATDGSEKSVSAKVTVNRPQGTSVTLDKTAIDLRIDETATVTASVVPATANSSFRWTSSDESIATVSAGANSATAIITACKTGSAFITATTTDGSNISASLVVTVKPALAQSVSLNKPSVKMAVGDSDKLLATVLPQTASQSVAWSSSASDIVSVDNQGNIKALALGSAAITATATDGSNKSARCLVTVDRAAVTSIVFDQTTLSLSQSSAPVKVNATVLPDYATNKTLQWTSGNSQVATVSSDGYVSPAGLGTTTVTAAATDGSGVSASLTVTVVADVAVSISIAPSAVNLEIGETATMKATILPSTASQIVTWKSSDPTIASIASNGSVTALTEGSATITATTTDGTNMSATATVTVKRPQAQSVSIDHRTLSLAVGESGKLNATVLPQTAAQTVNWSSSQPNVATVDAQGNVTAVSLGSAVITASATDGSGKSAGCVVNVDRAYVTSIVLDQTTLSLSQSSAPVKVNATVLPDYATNKTLKWESADTEIATVNEAGYVSPAGIGTTIITVSATDGSGVTVSLTVSVAADLAESISVTPPAVSLDITEIVRLTATVQPAAASQNVSWTSSDDSVATVDADGTVTARAEGTAIIIATTTDGTAKSATATIIVRPAKVSSIELMPVAVEMMPMTEFQIEATVLPDYASNPRLQWISSDSEVARVDNEGYVKAIKEGKAVITAMATDGSGVSATCNITVLEDDAIDEIGADTASPAPVYDLMGRKLLRPKRGIFIRNGKLILL